MSLRARARAALIGVAATLAVVLAIGGPATAVGPVAYGPPVFVDQQYAGGEPLLFADGLHGTLVYSSHEGTTHLYRPGFGSSTITDWVATYRNQVKIWTSKDQGKTWQRVSVLGSGFAQNPAQNTGFSDPDLTQDAGGRIYNTGINLASEALFSSPDGGLTWDRGTAQCQPGDRPWLAGAKKDEVFFAYNDQARSPAHRILVSTDGGNSCSDPETAIIDQGAGYQGAGKLLYMPKYDMLIEPEAWSDGVGLGTWKRGAKAFTPHKVAKVGVIAHWPAIAYDSAGTIYIVWDTDDRVKNSAGGCSGDLSPAPNAIQYAYSSDLGQTWSKPVTVTRPAGGRVLWPWIAAGDDGRVSIVWYQGDKTVDWDCQASNVSVYEANISGANTATPTQTITNVFGRPVHRNSICQGGTTCVATGQDRRLGDFFSNLIDTKGCVMVATGDTTKPDPVNGTDRIVSLPLFARQASGPSLTGYDCATGEKLPADQVNQPPPGSGPVTPEGPPPANRTQQGGQRTNTTIRLAIRFNRFYYPTARSLRRTVRGGAFTVAVRAIGKQVKVSSIQMFRVVGKKLTLIATTKRVTKVGRKAVRLRLVIKKGKKITAGRYVLQAAGQNPNGQRGIASQRFRLR
jgi:hypothetical protein